MQGYRSTLFLVLWISCSGPSADGVPPEIAEVVESSVC